MADGSGAAPLAAEYAPVCGGVQDIGGIVERVVYHDDYSGFCVLRVRTPGHRGRITVVGHAPRILAGESVQASGLWVRDREHGPQFRASALQSVPAPSRDGVEAYLASGLIRGIGPRYARRLAGAFGADLFDIIEHAPERLCAVEGIGPVRARRIAESWAEQNAVRDIMLFLQEHGMGSSRAVRVFKTYGIGAIDVIRADPYRLARDVPGIGFAAADAVAIRLGVAADAPGRLRAGLAHVLDRAREEGHCALPADVLVGRAADRLGVASSLAASALADAVAAGEMVQDALDGTACVFPAPLYEDERLVGLQLRRLRHGFLPWPVVDPAAAIARAESRAGITLSEGQRDAIALALRSKVSIVTGGPGVGKTLIVDAVVGFLRQHGVRTVLTAPTGRAARHLTESTGEAARTLHRLLEFEPVSGTFRRNEASPLDGDLIVVDEMSMVDVPLMAGLLRALPDRAALLMVGDVDQLPPIGPGQVLADLIGSGAVPTARVDEVFRQAAGSRIVAGAHRIRTGVMPEPVPPGAVSDFYFVGARDAADAMAKVVTLVAERIPRRFGLDPVRDVQVLSPTNEGGLGTRALNVELQRALNPDARIRIDRFGWSFRPGDKVMQVQNDYEKDLHNGDLGTVDAVDPEGRTVRVAFAGRRVDYAADELDQLALAYATTIHKAQGSEYPAVVIPVAAQHGPMLNRNLIYTGVTRGRRLVVLVGDRAALAAALGTRARRRRSKLKDWLALDSAFLMDAAG